VRAVPVLLVIPFALGFVLPLARLYGLASAAHAIIQAFAYLGILILAFLASGLVPGYDRASVPTRRRRRWLTFAAVLTSVVLGLLGFGAVVGFHALAVTSMGTVRWVLVAGFALPAAVLLLRSRTARLPKRSIRSTSAAPRARPGKRRCRGGRCGCRPALGHQGNRLASQPRDFRPAQLQEFSQVLRAQADDREDVT
jgi:hypothetical protein